MAPDAKMTAVTYGLRRRIVTAARRCGPGAAARTSEVPKPAAAPPLLARLGVVLHAAPAQRDGHQVHLAAQVGGGSNAPAAPGLRGATSEGRRATLARTHCTTGTMPDLCLDMSNTGAACAAPAPGPPACACAPAAAADMAAAAAGTAAAAVPPGRCATCSVSEVSGGK